MTKEKKRTRKYMRHDKGRKKNSQRVYDIIADNHKRNKVLASKTWGGFSRGIMNRTLIGWISARGGSPLAISMAVMPKDHMSACIRNKLSMNKYHQKFQQWFRNKLICCQKDSTPFHCIPLYSESPPEPSKKGFLQMSE